MIMKSFAHEIHGMPVHATDGEIGHVQIADSPGRGQPGIAALLRSERVVPQGGRGPGEAALLDGQPLHAVIHPWALKHGRKFTAREATEYLLSLGRNRVAAICGPASTFTACAPVRNPNAGGSALAFPAGRGW